MNGTPKVPRRFAPTRGFAELVAAVLLGVYLLASVILYLGAGDNRWDHRIKLFEALGSLVGLAVGWVFGKQVHRKAAEDAIGDANHGHQLAGEVRQALANYRKSAGTPNVETGASTPDDTTSSMPYPLESLAEAVNRLFPP
jgi:hypothetical protein